MGALLKIKKAGFDVTLVDGFIEISPASRLTEQQLTFLKSYKSEIISELKAEKLRKPETFISCGQCLNFKSHNLHGQGSGSCNADVQSNGNCWWADSLHDCEKFNAAVEWQELPEPKPDSLIVTCYTPANNPIRVQAKNPEHAQWLKRMNPKRVIP